MVYVTCVIDDGVAGTHISSSKLRAIGRHVSLKNLCGLERCHFKQLVRQRHMQDTGCCERGLASRVSEVNLRLFGHGIGRCLADPSVAEKSQGHIRYS